VNDRPVISVAFDPFDETLISAPYPTYHRLRSEDPVHWNPTLRCWVLTRMEDVAAVLHDGNFVVSSPAPWLAELAARANRNYDALINLLDRGSPLLQEGSRQRQNRQTIARVLNRVALSELRPAIKTIASSLCAQFRDPEAYDAIAVFAAPFPQYVMAHLLGLPSSDVPVLDDLLARLSLIFDLATLELYDELNAKLITVLDLLKSRISAVIAAGQENGLSIFYGTAPGSHEQKLAEAATAAAFLYRIATEATIGLIGMLFRLTIEKPALIEELRARPELIPATVSEVIRLESNIQRSMRVCCATCEIGGKVIKAGEPLLLLLGAANRDPASFGDPDSLNPHRGGIVDVAFGAGRHFCSGASLAHLEGCVALEQILDLPSIQRAGPEEWYVGRTVRRLRCLPVQVKKTRSIDA
jgi:pimeloyl-[acyl-carrier protein] synthase